MSLFDKLVKCPGCGIKFPSRTNYVNKLHEEKSSHQVSVEKFMRLGGQVVEEKPCIPSLEIRRLRAKLILEEALETINALGFYVDDDFSIMESFEPDLTQIVDGCCDLRVVTTGTLSACGVKDVRPQELVDENNLDKFQWPDGIKCVRNKDGKILKPPTHKPPELKEELNRQCNLHS